ncbi:TPA_asm: coat protein [ssRNA phage Gerhypos.4_67]|uniref:Coat protein n=2 Tax=Fiersviridae TaxID=2842319 RepID=A0A8S5L253_9VIRU|nr:coat protein [ssRNA phage Gerhypos.4_67]QDH90399.1 MAG: hypothetical protein H4Bulk48492_000002 [Leviviridae sp.]DAD51453.1 TPA_asm: coat protein [ssRNA phage Gerhypos.4_67]
MPTAAAITIKKNDGTTDVVYNVVTASGGDKSPALFRADALPGTPGQKPVLSVSSQPNGTQTGRRISISYSYPQVYTETNTSLTQVRTKANARIDVYVPLDMDTTSANEFGAQLGNLMASALMKSVAQTGFAPA